jgi:hypothetical protein
LMISSTSTSSFALIYNRHLDRYRSTIQVVTLLSLSLSLSLKSFSSGS